MIKNTILIISLFIFLNAFAGTQRGKKNPGNLSLNEPIELVSHGVMVRFYPEGKAEIITKRVALSKNKLTYTI